MTDPNVMNPTPTQEEVTLKLNAEEAEMIKELLSDYSYAWLSDATTNCKRVLINKDKIGTYPYVDTPPTGVTNPVYDWTAKKWRSSDTASKDQYEDVYAEIKALKGQGQDSNVEIAALRESGVSVNKNLAELGQQFNSFGSQVMDALKELATAVNGKTNSNTTAPTAPDESEEVPKEPTKTDETEEATKKGDAE